MEMKIGPIEKSVVVRTDECKERLALLFEKGLKSPLGCNETIIMRHDELQSIFPGLPIQFFPLNFPRRRVKVDPKKTGCSRKPVLEIFVYFAKNLLSVR